MGRWKIDLGKTLDKLYQQNLQPTLGDVKAHLADVLRHQIACALYRFHLVDALTTAPDVFPRLRFL